MGATQHNLCQNFQATIRNGDNFCASCGFIIADTPAMIVVNNAEETSASQKSLDFVMGIVDRKVVPFIAGITGLAVGEILWKLGVGNVDAWIFAASAAGICALVIFGIRAVAKRIA